MTTPQKISGDIASFGWSGRAAYRRHFDSYVLPQTHGRTFIPTGWANVPLHKNWSKTSSKYRETQAKLGGWLLVEGNISFSEGPDGLAQPNAEPLDAVIIHGINCPHQMHVGDSRGTNYTKNSQDLDIALLVLLHDLESKDPEHTKAWLSMETTGQQHYIAKLDSFAPVPTSHFFSTKQTKSRITRFTKKLKEALA
jgi:hypothetical protein